jgi:hypothetical protein
MQTKPRGHGPARHSFGADAMFIFASTHMKFPAGNPVLTVSKV